jgi:hypothetical protein
LVVVVGIDSERIGGLFLNDAPRGLTREVTQHDAHGGACLRLDVLEGHALLTSVPRETMRIDYDNNILRLVTQC